MADSTETVYFPVTQSINPWVFNIGFNSGLGGTTSGATVAMGKSRNAALETAIVDGVGTYGRQIGRIGEALQALIEALDLQTLTDRQRKAFADFKDQMDAVEAIRKLHPR